MKTARQKVISRAVHSLTSCGERVERDPVGWLANGEPHSEEELVAYANELRAIERMPALRLPRKDP